MITKAQATSAGWRAEFHYTGRQECSRIVGPRGGVKITITVARLNGNAHTWKTRPADFRVPVVHGLHEYGAITQANAQHWHRAEDCPAKS